MEETNSFKKLLEEDERYYHETYHEKSQNNIHSSMSMFRLIGDLFHLFVPHMADSAAISMGAEDSVTQNLSPDTNPPSEGFQPPPGPEGPGSPGLGDIR